ncbi:MAG: hypothetical protein KDN22_01115 [Verrucomicrobiae bacterium]|nr:hypothetical protein [Verrucomicrobiae bacterium]
MVRTAHGGMLQVLHLRFLCFFEVFGGGFSSFGKGNSGILQINEQLCHLHPKPHGRRRIREIEIQVADVREFLFRGGDVALCCGHDGDDGTVEGETMIWSHVCQGPFPDFHPSVIEPFASDEFSDVDCHPAFHLMALFPVDLGRLRCGKVRLPVERGLLP